MDQLPLDIIHRIADRLPFKCLAMFRCLRKEWYADPFFKTCMTKFIEKPTIISLDVQPRRDGIYDRKPRFDVDIDRNLVKASIPQLARPNPQLARPKRSRLMGTCNGLMCFFVFNAPGNFVVLVNPLLNKVLSISTWPPSDINLWEDGSRFATGLGLDHASGVYKLVMFSPVKILLFDFYTWWEISSPDREEISPWGVGIFLGGTLYWKSRYRGYIVSFDVAKEEFSLLPCPTSIDTLFDLGNHLGVATSNQRAGHIDIWEFNLHSKRWTNKYKIDSPLLIERSSLWGGYYFDIIGTQNEMILFKSLNTIYSYDPWSRKLESVHEERPGTEFYCLRGSVESLSQFNV